MYPCLNVSCIFCFFNYICSYMTMFTCLLHMSREICFYLSCHIRCIIEITIWCNPFLYITIFSCALHWNSPLRLWSVFFFNRASGSQTHLSTGNWIWAPAWCWFVLFAIKSWLGLKGSSSLFLLKLCLLGPKKSWAWADLEEGVVLCGLSHKKSIRPIIYTVE